MPRGGKPKGWDDYPLPIRDESSGCLLWQGPMHSNGYGKIGSKRYAHRVAYERAHGPIPDGFQVDHVRARGCVYRHCVEPTHLEAVTQAENLRRSERILAQIEAISCPSGHLYSGHNLIVRRGKRECRACTYARNKANREKRRREKR